MSLPNQGIFIGRSNKLIYDQGCYEDKLKESTGPLLYRLDPNQINNCNACLSVFGPRTTNGPSSYGVSTPTGNKTALSQNLVDVESILTNRNVLASKCKAGGANDIDVTKFNLKHARVCNHFLDPIATHLTNPPQNYREMSINRFYNLQKNPQHAIYSPIMINTKLEAKDNYKVRIPRLINYDPALPNELKGCKSPCIYKCPKDC